MIKVLILDSQKIYGGGQKFYLDIIEHLDRERFTFSVSSPLNSPVHKIASEKKIEFIPFTPKSRFDILGMIKFAKSIIKSGCDIIVGTDSITWYTTAIIRYFSKSIRLVSIVHISTLGTGKKFGKFKRKIIQIVDRWWIDKNNKVIVSSKWHYDIYVSEGIKKDKLALIYNAVNYKVIRSKVSNENIQEIKDKYKIDKDKKIVGMIGRFGPGKDFENFIESMPLILKRYKDVQFVLVGDGPYNKKLRNLCVKLNIENTVVFTGFVFDDYYNLLNLFDIFVNSTDAEGISYAVLDAMSLQKPLVATHIGGIEDAVKDGVNGILVPVKKPDSLAKAVVDLLNNKMKCEEFGKNSEIILNESFSLSVMISKIENLFLGLF